MLWNINKQKIPICESNAEINEIDEAGGEQNLNLDNKFKED